jgi:hypothetical protein
MGSDVAKAIPTIGKLGNSSNLAIAGQSRNLASQESIATAIGETDKRTKRRRGQKRSVPVNKTVRRPPHIGRLKPRLRLLLTLLASFNGICNSIHSMIGMASSPISRLSQGRGRSWRGRHSAAIHKRARKSHQEPAPNLHQHGITRTVHCPLSRTPVSMYSTE